MDMLTRNKIVGCTNQKTLKHELIKEVSLANTTESYVMRHESHMKVAFYVRNSVITTKS